MFNYTVAGQPQTPERRSRSTVPVPPLARQPACSRDRGHQGNPVRPVSHPFIERLIGTVRREYLDRMFF
jgi:hypothetical protein